MIVIVLVITQNTVNSPLRAPPPIRAPPVFYRTNSLVIGRFWSYLSQKWSDFHSVKSLWKVEMSSIK